jgi:4-aminobutyrate aminotransferase/(S)-3-amino-2-methylpropionate transaminase
LPRRCNWPVSITLTLLDPHILIAISTLGWVSTQRIYRWMMEFDNNHFVGDPIRLLQCQSILSIIKEEKLQEKVNQVSPMLRSGLVQLSRDHDRWIRDIRGMGTFFAWNCGNAKDRDLLVLKLRSLGVHMGPCGDCGIRVRPSLIFGPDHCRLFLEILEEALISLSKQ